MVAARRASTDDSPVRSALLRRLPQGALVALGATFVTLIAVADWLAGPTVSLEVFYALAVIGATWLGGRTHGILAAGLAAADSLAASAVHSSPIMIGPGILWNAASRFVGLWLIAVLVGRLRASLVLQRRHAMTDALTGVLNRRAFHIAAERERLRATRDHTPISLAYLDLDGFKSINDLRGHSGGDDVLTEVAGTLAGAVRGSDVVARIGGDEFAVLLPGADARDAVGVLSRIRRSLAEVTAGGAGPVVTMSIGLATYHEPPATVDEMLAEADSLMYRAKVKGRDRIIGTVISGPWWDDRARTDAAGIAARLDRTAVLTHQPGH